LFHSIEENNINLTIFLYTKDYYKKHTVEADGTVVEIPPNPPISFRNILVDRLPFGWNSMLFGLIIDKYDC
jgi:hypothetical protein